ncbi:Oidioi.mRNA.OKI2018_I69.PAR.g9551.t1.cds [Oikopleura dioica]|uniref:Oidioi.mRNA.OKI2018_I69.PAR.g9551.t1.cds n=1 Tax=Oikopleura dioica TaxID=34765 RepID=A0ABN7RL82_OIKDI|nr:Oidioi.mRNA.OKI2018_I69.PAR.g9551.t1.cds [Oikopleura dioica]
MLKRVFSGRSRKKPIEENSGALNGNTIAPDAINRRSISPRIARNESIRRDVKPGILVAIFTNTFAKGPKGRQLSIKGLRRSKSQGPGMRKKSDDARMLKSTKSFDNLSALRLAKTASALKDENTDLAFAQKKLIKGDDDSGSDSSADDSQDDREEAILADINDDLGLEDIEACDSPSEEDSEGRSETASQFFQEIEREIEEQETTDNYY